MREIGVYPSKICTVYIKKNITSYLFISYVPWSLHKKIN